MSGLKVGKIENVEAEAYDGDNRNYTELNSIGEIFEHRFSQCRNLVRNNPNVNNDRDHGDSYATGQVDESFGTREWRKNKVAEEREFEPVLRFEYEDGREVEYKVQRLNTGNELFHSHSPNSLLLEQVDGDDRKVLHECKYYRNPDDAFTFGNKGFVDYEERGANVNGSFTSDADSFYIPEGTFFMGYANIHESLREAEGLSPLVPDIAFVESRENEYDESARFPTYYVRDFDPQHTQSENYPDLSSLADLIRTMDVLGVERIDRSGAEIMETHSSNGLDFLYESDREKMTFHPDTPPQEMNNAALARDMLHTVHSNQVTGERVPIDALDEIMEMVEEPEPDDVDYQNIRSDFEEGLNFLDPSEIDDESPFFDVT